ncbi:hypothetical protein pipiens_008328 [Culex pipiens pipiens]|uniref:C2H2-type domain-containing protein n=1 Tax=Culex pipiens pipiens TaxID=38569 RepID=A0ABD1DI61_CULPP
MLELITNGIMTSSGMDISESFRPEDLGKTDFFDFVGSAGTRDAAANGGQSEETAASAGAADRPPGVGGGGGGGGGSSGTSSSSSASSSRNGPDGGVNGSGGSVADSGNGSSGSGTSNNQPLQGFDQFWGPDKDANRLDQTMFDDINRYCWIQQQGSGPGQQPQQQAGGAVSNTVADTDGQIYTLTVLNGAPEPWVLRKDPSAAEPPPPASNLDLDTILGGFPGYVKTECFSYDDSGFGTDHHGKEDQQQQLLNQQQQQHQHQQHLHQQVQQIPVTSTNIVLSNSLMDPNSVIAYQNNNNNDWQMSDHNVIEHETTSESLLRCALQGKGYTKGTAVQLQNGGITVIPAGQIKEEDLRRLVYTGEADTMAYADSTLSANPLFEDSTLHSPGSNHNPAVNNPQHVQHPVVGDLGSGVVVDDMFLTLDSTFTEDYEKLKRIASEVQQFCTDNNNYTEIIVETAAAINQHQNPALISSNNSLVISSAAANTTGHHAISTTTSSDVVTTTSTTKVKAPRSSKKYKRSLNNNNNSANSTTTTNNNNSIAVNNNNNNTSMSNLNTTAVSILSSTTSSSQNPSSNPSPTGHCNGQRKERSLHYCSICSKGFKDKYSVNVHIRTHTGEKPFACSLCGKSFRQKAHLAKHYQTHMAQKNPAGNVKAGKQSRAAAEQAAAAAAAAALQQSPVAVAAPPPPLPSLTAAGTLQSQAVASSGATVAPILLNTATIVASR